MPIPLTREPALSPNQRAMPIIQEMIDRRHDLCIAIQNIGGATVLDCGVHTEGGFEAGLMFSRVCLGGLAEVTLTWADYGEYRWPSVSVMTDHPIRACMASQYAGWPISCDGKLYMGSGPACAVVCRGSLFRYLGYKDETDVVVLCLECPRLPNEDVIALIAKECGCRSEQLYILAAPTASVAGSVQVAARALETALFKLRRLKYDLGKVEAGMAICPVSPIAGTTKHALGRTNDAISYGAVAQILVRDTDEALRDIVPQVPSSSAPGYGKSYIEIASGHDNFFNLSPEQFNPAVIEMCNLNTGRVFRAGAIRTDVLRRSFAVETL
ncbi:MAG TPA: methenyltetrahydromethanopterin cyclohydrolase [Papillibacter sp.]|jgi:methenyltetrahydromethanopterin cyclohydrolase|nr:methenyltetrahydromethanopterin cyclohydrolase [Papillibacter sp.]